MMYFDPVEEAEKIHVAIDEGFESTILSSPHIGNIVSSAATAFSWRGSGTLWRAYSYGISATMLSFQDTRVSVTPSNR